MACTLVLASLSTGWKIVGHEDAGVETPRLAGRLEDLMSAQTSLVCNAESGLQWRSVREMVSVDNDGLTNYALSLSRLNSLMAPEHGLEP